MLKNFGNCWKEIYWSIIRFVHIIILFKNWGHSSIFNAIWEAAGLNKPLKRFVRSKQNISALDFNVFGGIASCGEPFLGSKFCSCIAFLQL